LILYDYPASPNCRKVRIVLCEKGVDYERRLVDISKGEHRAEAFLAINPHGRLPALQDTIAPLGGESRTISVYDSTVINEYLEDAYPDPPLFPAAPADRAAARLLEDWADNLLIEPAGELYGQFVFTAESRRQKTRIEEARRRSLELLRRIDDILRDGRPYVLGNYSIADAAMTPSMAYLMQFGTPVGELMPRVHEWFLRLKSRPSFQA
jgi:glutathione S-transferase